MKRIEKNTEPQEFIDWKKNGHPKTWRRFHRHTPIKKKVQASLKQEQGYLCCFCESVISDRGHIAHVLAKSNHEALALDYSNLLYSCAETPHGEPNTCGHAQGTSLLPISPLDADCESHFAFGGDGSILALDDKANETNLILNLNGSKNLRDGRRAAYEETFDKKTTSSPAEFDSWVTEVLSRDAEGRFKKPFWTTIKYVAENV